MSTAGIPILCNEKVWPLCRSELLTSGGMEQGQSQLYFYKTQSSTWFLFQLELCYSALLLIPKWPKCTFWVYKLNYELPIKYVARSVQHFISADCAEADSVPLWTQSTRFWKHHQALGSHSSKDGREVTCMTRFLQTGFWKNLSQMDLQ